MRPSCVVKTNLARGRPPQNDPCERSLARTGGEGFSLASRRGRLSASPSPPLTRRLATEFLLMHAAVSSCMQPSGRGQQVPVSSRDCKYVGGNSSSTPRDPRVDRCPSMPNAPSPPPPPERPRTPQAPRAQLGDELGDEQRNADRALGWATLTLPALTSRRPPKHRRWARRPCGWGYSAPPSPPLGALQCAHASASELPASQPRAHWAA